MPETERKKRSAVRPNRPVSYPPDAVLLIDQVAEWLGVDEATVYDYPIPYVELGPRTRRYLGKHVYEFLESRVRAA